MTAISAARKFAGFGAAVATLLAVAGCATQPKTPLTAEQINARVDVYRLGLGDKVRVNVFGEPALSGEFQVSGNGAITMPLIGDVKGVGLTAREMEAALVARYAAGYLKDPKIAVEVYDFRPYFVLGEVAKPGRYPAGEDATILGAIATAGGFTYRANKNKVFVRRAGDTAEHEVDINANMKVLPGDVLRVGERYF